MRSPTEKRRAAAQRIERSEEDIRLNGETARVSGRARIAVLVGDVPREAQVRYLAVWARGTQGGQLVAFQATPITAYAGASSHRTDRARKPIRPRVRGPDDPIAREHLSV